jgi:hypothetical protein
MSAYSQMAGCDVLKNVCKERGHYTYRLIMWNI